MQRSSRKKMTSTKSSSSSPLLFYSTRGEYGCFSNFSHHPLSLPDSNGVMQTWPTSEHYFQACKFPNTEHESRIRQLSSPGAAAKTGRTTAGLRADWERVKDDIMMTAVKAKFTQHPDILKTLMETADRTLIEHTHDRYWVRECIYVYYI